jgi:adenylate kinase
MNIILIGIQGSGKGTQAQLLSKKSGWEHINVGDLFRRNIEQKTELGIKAKTFIDKGELVPDKYVFDVVEEAILKAKNGFILDGFPRNIEQLKFLTENIHIDKVILLVLDDKIAIKRISARRNCERCKKVYNIIYNRPHLYGYCDECGSPLIQRDDDNEIAVAKRIEKFHQETQKVIELFKKEGKLLVVDANHEVEAIHKEIVSKLTA